jgi:Skp family chaperone for outer membrane proteins
VASEQSGRSLDPGSRVILAELRDLRREMRADRQEAKEERRQSDAERRRSDERFEQLMRNFQQDSARREAATQQAFVATQRAFRDVRTVGLSIVKTLNRHTRILERIDRKLGVRNDGRPGQDNDRGA